MDANLKSIVRQTAHAANRMLEAHRKMPASWLEPDEAEMIIENRQDVLVEACLAVLVELAPDLASKLASGPMEHRPGQDPDAPALTVSWPDLDMQRDYHIRMSGLAAQPEHHPDANLASWQSGWPPHAMADWAAARRNELPDLVLTEPELDPASLSWPEPDLVSMSWAEAGAWTVPATAEGEPDLEEANARLVRTAASEHAAVHGAHQSGKTVALQAPYGLRRAEDAHAAALESITRVRDIRVGTTPINEVR